MISNSPETRLVSISVRAISMHRTESRDISNRKYLSKTILACRERQAKKVHMLENNGFFGKTMGFFWKTMGFFFLKKSNVFDTTLHIIYFDYKAYAFYQNKKLFMFNINFLFITQSLIEVIVL